jgi:phosphoribosyl-ATP pyrophosphohydrolase
MIIPSIDLMGGSTVQLIGGREKAVDAGDPLPIAERFGISGELAVIDLDAALGRGENRALIRGILGVAPCRIGGGIRDLRTAVAWLDAGASKVILGTAAKPELLSQLPRERVIAALDADRGEVVVDGWQRRTGRGILERMRELRAHVGGFLVTFVEREGRMGGVDLAEVAALAREAGDARLTIAGGVTTPDEIAAIDRLGVDAQVGMALYTGRLDLADAIAAPVISDRPDGLWPTVVASENGTALGLAWSSRESLRQAVAMRRGVYQSRSRGIWVKGERSGAVQELLRIDLDCDRDALRFTVRQHGEGFCHRRTATCWGGLRGLDALEMRLRKRLDEPEAGSYTARLLSDPVLLRSKLMEEAAELAAAGEREQVIAEAADLLYFSLVRVLSAGATLADVEAVLDRRSLSLTRRPGDAKPGGRQ